MNIDITTDGKNITLAAVIPARDAKALDQLIRAIKSAKREVARVRGKDDQGQPKTTALSCRTYPLHRLVALAIVRRAPETSQHRVIAMLWQGHGKAAQLSYR